MAGTTVLGIISGTPGFDSKTQDEPGAEFLRVLGLSHTAGGMEGLADELRVVVRRAAVAVRRALWLEDSVHVCMALASRVAALSAEVDMPRCLWIGASDLSLIVLDESTPLDPIRMEVIDLAAERISNGSSNSGHREEVAVWCSLFTLVYRAGV